MKHLLLIIIAAVLLPGCGKPNDLWKAALKGDLDTVKRFIASGADVNAKDDNGFTVLQKAVDHKEIAEALIDAGADVNATGFASQTPLHSAANIEIVELLISKGADVNATDRYGNTPLDEAIDYENTKTADLLRKHGGKTSSELKAEGK